MTELRVALAQVNTCVGDLTGNVDTVCAWSVRALDAGADLAVFPEMTLTGYPIEDLAYRDSVVQASQRAVEECARRLVESGAGDLTVVVGYLDQAVGRIPGDRRPYAPTNAAAVLRGGQVLARYRKHHLPNYGVFDEFRIFRPGTDPCIVEVGGRRVAVAICEDLWQDGDPVAGYAEAGVDLLVVPNGSPYELGKTAGRLEVTRRAAKALAAPVIYVNLVGGQDDLVFDGGSFVVDNSGAVVGRAPQFDEHLLLASITDDGTVLTSAAQLAPGGEDSPTAVVPTGTAWPSIATTADAPLSDAEEMYRAIVLGLRDYVRKNGFRSTIVGLSGGIDSALVASLAVDALGAANVVAVSMPSEYSSEHSKDDAADLARRTGLDYRVEPIANKVAGFLAETPVDGIAEENLQARIRGLTLMALSNQEGHLVLAPGNKSELATGYSTIYGDAVGGFAPIKDVLKTQVWALARWRNDYATERGLTPPIPVSSIEKAPSAELRPGQQDTDSLPPYELLDAVLTEYIENASSKPAMLAAGFDADVIDRVLTLVDRAEWKRRQYPPGPKVTALAFGRDRRLPITSRWRER